MKNLLSIVILFLLVGLPALLFGQHDGLYSSTCDDWSTKGWDSKMECLQDGRWHEIYGASGAYDCATIAQEIYNHRNYYEDGIRIMVTFDDRKNSQIKSRINTEEGNEIYFYDESGTQKLILGESGSVDYCDLNANGSSNSQFRIFIKY